MEYILKAIREAIFGVVGIFYPKDKSQKRKLSTYLPTKLKGFGIDKEKLRRDWDNVSPLHRAINPWK